MYKETESKYFIDMLTIVENCIDKQHYHVKNKASKEAVSHQENPLQNYFSTLILMAKTLIMELV